MAKRDVLARLRDLEMTEQEQRAALLVLARLRLDEVSAMLTCEEWAVLQGVDLLQLRGLTDRQRAIVAKFRDVGGVSAAWSVIDYLPDAERDAAYMRVFGVPYTKGLSDNAQRSF